MFNFPWTNFHELNLDWILSVVKEAKEVFDNGRSDIDYAVETADEAKEIATQAAEATIPDNSISTSKIQNNAVTGEKLANNSVTSANIVDHTITGNDIAENTITNYNIQNGSLIGADLEDATITTAKLANALITAAKLAQALRRINLRGYHIITGRSDGNIAFTVPITGIYSTATLELESEISIDIVSNSGGDILTMSYNTHEFQNGYIWLSFTPSHSIASVLPQGNVGRLSIRGNNYINLA